MDLYCTRPGCPRPANSCADLDHSPTLKTIQQKYCTACGMPLILDSRYLTTRLLGRGGFGAAFLACDRRMPNLRPCVIKQFQPPSDFSPQQLEIAQQLFEREGEVLETLGNEHPQIPDLYAFFPLRVASLTPQKVDEFFYLAQEFVDGQDLQAELDQKGQLSEVEVLEILREILKVLQFVHEHNSIHRDIKPSNIMRHRKGLLYLLDFGAVKDVTKGSGMNSSTGIYSLGYAPPEQTSGGRVFPATDLYALAATCLTLLTGRQPTDLLDSYSNAWNWRMYTHVSDELAAILERMLMATPSQRFQTATDVLMELTKVPAYTPSPNSWMPPVVSSTQSTSLQPPPPSSSLAGRAQPPTIPSPANPTIPSPLSIVPPASPAPTTPPVPSAPSPSPLQQPVPVQRSTPTRRRSAIQPFSVLEIVAGGAFAGFEGGLLGIMLTNVLGVSLVSTGLGLVLIGILVFCQSRRWIEKWDLLILSGITICFLFIPFLRGGWTILGALTVSGAIALVTIVTTACWRLIYNLLKKIGT